MSATVRMLAARRGVVRSAAEAQSEGSVASSSRPVGGCDETPLADQGGRYASIQTPPAESNRDADPVPRFSLDVPTTHIAVEKHPLAKQKVAKRRKSFLRRDADEDRASGGCCSYFQKSVFFEDPHYPENIFLSSKRMGMPFLLATSKAKSLHIFSIDNPFRRFTIHLTTNEFFDFFIVATIFINCVFLALNQSYEYIELLFASLYTVEMLLKIVAFGFFHHKLSYLRNPWNILDFAVVLLGWVTLAPGLANLSPLRAFRVLRALRTINALPGLRIMVTSVLQSLRALGDVFILMLFFLFVSSVLGVQLFSGSLLNKCVLPDGGDMLNGSEYGNDSTMWHGDLQNSSYWLTDATGNFIVCGNATSATTCPSTSTCLPAIGKNPNHGYTSFDNFGVAFLTSIQLFTLDYWENVYILTIDAAGAPAVIFFYFVVFGGAFYTLNLVLAVVTLSYNKASETEMAHGAELLDAAKVAYEEELSASSNINVCLPSTPSDPVTAPAAATSEQANATTSNGTLQPTSLGVPARNDTLEPAPQLLRLSLDPPRPPMAGLTVPASRRASAPALGSNSYGGHRPESRPPAKPQHLRVTRPGIAEDVGAHDTVHDARSPPLPTNGSQPTVAHLEQRTGMGEGEAAPRLGAAVPFAANAGRTSPSGTTVGEPSSASLTTPALLPPVLTRSPLLGVLERTPPRLSVRSLALPEASETGLPTRLPPLEAMPATNRIWRSATTNTAADRLAPLPGSASPTHDDRAPLLSHSDSVDACGGDGGGGGEDELRPLLSSSQKQAATRPGSSSAGADGTALASGSSNSGAPSSLSLAQRPSTSSMPAFSKRSTSTASVASRSRGTPDFVFHPVPLPPTVLVQDEEENLVEAVEVGLRQRLHHHIDVIWWPLARATSTFVMSTKFEMVIMACIAINTVILAIEHPFMDPDLELGLCIANLVLGTVFLVEAILKLCAYGLRGYFRVAWNVFDSLIVLFSILEFLLMATGGGVCHSDTSNIATVFRAFRLLRILKMAQSWSTMRSLLSIIANSIKDLGYLTLVMIIIICTFALVGLHLFRPYYTTVGFTPDGIPRWNFIDFVHSLMLIFRILCGEWIEPLYDTMRVTHESAAIFYLIVLAVGNFLILNLFLALLLNSFDVEQIKQRKDNTEEKESLLKRLGKRLQKLSCFRNRRVSPKTRKRMQSTASRKMTSASKSEADGTRQRLKAKEHRGASQSGRKKSEPSVKMAVMASAGSEQGAKRAGNSPRVRRISEMSTSSCTQYLSEELDTTLSVRQPRKRALSAAAASTPRATIAPAQAANTDAKRARRQTVSGLPTVTVTPSDLPLRTVDTRRLSLEETTINDAGSQEVRLSVRQTRIRSSSFSSVRSMTSMIVAGPVGSTSNLSLQPNHSKMSVEASSSSTSMVTRQPAIAAAKAAATSSSAAMADGTGGGHSSRSTEQSNCCTCVTSHRCCHVWCLCALTRKVHASADDIEMVQLNGNAGRNANDDVSDGARPGHEPRNSLGCRDGLAACLAAVRNRLRRIVVHSYFDNIILVLVVFSSMSLAFEDSYVQNGSPRDVLLQQLNIIFTSLFTAELVIKNLGLGVREYFRSPWNVLDCIIVVVSLASLNYTGGHSTNNLSALRALRTLRCLRPLRTISRWNGMKAVVNALLQSIPGISNVLLVCFIIWLIFSIMGVQFFGGLFYKCEVDGVRISHYLVTDKNDCIAQYNESAWVNSPQNFDNVLNAALALFQVATFEGWIELMADAVDATGLNRQPVYENNFAANIYFVVFIVIGSFFVLNLFIGVIIDSFNRIKKLNDNEPTFSKFLTPSQQAWINAWKKMADRKPIKTATLPTGRVRRCFYKVVNDQRFEIGVMGVIMANAIVIATEHYGQSSTWTDVQFYLNAIFSGLYILEAGAKLYVWRKAYFYSAWNLFDLLVIVLSIAGLVIGSFAQTISLNPSLLRIVRLVRIARVLRLVRRAQGIRRLLFTLLYSLPALLNVGALLFLIIYMYSILGMSLFGNVKHNGVLGQQINFQDFPHAFLVLFRIATAAGWNEVLYGLMIDEPFCDPSHNGEPNGNCGYPIIAPIYLGSFVLVSYLIVVNMYIAIVLENFTETEEVGLADADLEAFYETWVKFDPSATQFIPMHNIQPLIRKVPRPLGIPNADLETIAALDIPLFKDEAVNVGGGDGVGGGGGGEENSMLLVAHCLDVMDALVRRVLTQALGDVGEDSGHFAQMMQSTQEKFNEKFPSRSKITVVSRSGEVMHATLMLQKAVRRFLEAKRRREAVAASEAVFGEEEMLISVDGEDGQLIASRSAVSVTSALLPPSPACLQTTLVVSNDAHRSPDFGVDRSPHELSSHGVSKIVTTTTSTTTTTTVKSSFLPDSNPASVSSSKHSLDVLHTTATAAALHIQSLGVADSRSSRSITGRAADLLQHQYSTSTRALLLPQGVPAGRNFLSAARADSADDGDYMPKTRSDIDLSASSRRRALLAHSASVDIPDVKPRRRPSNSGENVSMETIPRAGAAAFPRGEATVVTTHTPKLPSIDITSHSSALPAKEQERRGNSKSESPEGEQHQSPVSAADLQGGSRGRGDPSAASRPDLLTASPNVQQSSAVATEIKRSMSRGPERPARNRSTTAASASPKALPRSWSSSPATERMLLESSPPRSTFTGSVSARTSPQSSSKSSGFFSKLVSSARSLHSASAQSLNSASSGKLLLRSTSAKSELSLDGAATVSAASPTTANVAAMNSARRTAKHTAAVPEQGLDRIDIVVQDVEIADSHSLADVV